MQSPVTPYLLLIACEEKEQLDEETKDIISTLFDTTKQNIKIIFITPLGGSISHILHHLSRILFGNAFVIVSKELTWSDLTTSDPPQCHSIKHFFTQDICSPCCSTICTYIHVPTVLLYDIRYLA
jgi:hypothetical protein